MSLSINQRIFKLIRKEALKRQKLHAITEHEAFSAVSRDCVAALSAEVSKHLCNHLNQWPCKFCGGDAWHRDKCPLRVDPPSNE